MVTLAFAERVDQVVTMVTVDVELGVVTATPPVRGTTLATVLKNARWNR